MDKAKKVFNELLVNCFREINKIEEQAIKAMTNDELSLTEIHTIEAVGTDGSKKMSDVASILQITVSTLTISINRLVNKGYVERYRCENDKRVVKVMLTDKGKTVLSEHEKFHENMIEFICDNLDETQINIVVKSISKLLSFFSEESSKFNRTSNENEIPVSDNSDDEILNYELVEG